MLSDLITGRRIEGFRIDEFSATIPCECLLRFVGNDGAFIIAEDHGHKDGLPEPFDAEAQFRKYVLGKRVTETELQGETGDIILKLACGRLKLMCWSSGHENRQLNGPNFLFTGYGGRLQK